MLARMRPHAARPAPRPRTETEHVTKGYAIRQPYHACIPATNLIDTESHTATNCTGRDACGGGGLIGRIVLLIIALRLVLVPERLEFAGSDKKVVRSVLANRRRYECPLKSRVKRHKEGCRPGRAFTRRPPPPRPVHFTTLSGWRSDEIRVTPPLTTPGFDEAQ
ncbi:hypothetical protein EVAR_78279_1 [Eumeta japonica]|uniref:Uncharacterized protein n=1 Tax=Eumeta variegata TaxID=151549 RepID=A0A4C1T5Z0_EUMVA|nr:hypothetical protein EVAR_78279_1 [Eumeta japonica]